MAEGRSYGDLLREARERRGIDLVTMARALHIRPDIVSAIETADFRKMPAHGYTKNMVRAYARQVGLDEVSISQSYAEARGAYEGTSLLSQNIPASSGRSQRLEGRSRRLEEPSRRFTQDAPERRSARSQSVSRRVDEPRREARSQRVGAPQRSSGLSDLVSSISARGSQRESRVHSSFTQGGTMNGMQGQMRRGGAPLGGGRSLPAFNLRVILAIVGAVLVIIIAVVLFNGGKQSVSDVPDIPISGLTDTSAVDESSQSTQLATAPSSAVFSFSVEDGAKAWVTVNLNGDTTPVYAQIAEGPVTEDFEVTGTLTFETANIAAITLTVDGEEVQASPAATGTNYVYTVDFPAILYEWKKDHGMLDTSDGEGSSAGDDDAEDGTSNAQNGSSPTTRSSSNASSPSTR